MVPLVPSGTKRIGWAKRNFPGIDAIARLGLSMVPAASASAQACSATLSSVTPSPTAPYSRGSFWPAPDSRLSRRTCSWSRRFSNHLAVSAFVAVARRVQSSVGRVMTPG